MFQLVWIECMDEKTKKTSAVFKGALREFFRWCVLFMGALYGPRGMGNREN